MSNEAYADDSIRSADVTIIGFGPVGKLLAILLGRAGHRVIIVDRKLEGYPLPRAVTHDFEFARILQHIGLAPDTIPDVTEPYDDMYVWRNADLQTLVEVDWSGIGSSGWYNTYFFNQPALEDRMEALVLTLPTVEVIRGWSATISSTSEEGTTVSIKNVATGERALIESQWLIGADGAKSSVREAVGISWHDVGFYYDWLVVDVKPDPALKFPHVAIQTCDIGRPATMVPGGPARRRWEFMRLPDETIESLNQIPRAWQLLEPFGINPDNAELERHSVYTFQAGWADEWRKGRVLLAGDAAHLMPPFAGQGLGAGFRDAMNLAWKLDAVLKGHSSEKIIDTYSSERLPHIQAFIHFSIALGRVICITDPIEAAERDSRMMAQLGGGTELDAPPAPLLGVGAHTAAGGTLSPQGRVECAGRVGRFDDFFPRGALVLADAAELESISASARATLDDHEIAVVVLSGPAVGAAVGASTIVDTDGVYGEWLARSQAEAVLIRPDFYTYGFANAADLGELIASFADVVGAGVAS